MTSDVSTTTPTEEEIAQIIREAGVDEYAAASRIAQLFAQKRLPSLPPATAKPISAHDALAQAISWIEDLPRKNASHQMVDHVLEDLRAPLVRAGESSPGAGAPPLDSDTAALLRRIHFVLNVRKGDTTALGSDVWEGGDGFPRSRPFTDIFCEEIDAALTGKAAAGRVVGLKPAFDLLDFVTHRRVWRSSLVSEMGNANRRGDDISYWKREIEVFDRCFDIIEPFEKAANADEAADLFVRVRECWDEDECPAWVAVEPLVSELARRAAGAALRAAP